MLLNFSLLLFKSLSHDSQVNCHLVVSFRGIILMREILYLFFLLWHTLLNTPAARTQGFLNDQNSIVLPLTLHSTYIYYRCDATIDVFILLAVSKFYFYVRAQGEHWDA